MYCSGTHLRVLQSAGSSRSANRLDFEEGVQADLDPYGFEVKGGMNVNENGAPVGRDVQFISKKFTINHANVGMSKTGFFDKASGQDFDDGFAPHLQSGKPFWFAWNTDEESDGVYLCYADEVRMPFIGSLNRRALISTFHGYREVS